MATQNAVDTRSCQIAVPATSGQLAVIAKVAVEAASGVAKGAAQCSIEDQLGLRRLMGVVLSSDPRRIDLAQVESLLGVEEPWQMRELRALGFLVVQCKKGLTLEGVVADWEPIRSSMYPEPVLHKDDLKHVEAMPVGPHSFFALPSQGSRVLHERQRIEAASTPHIWPRLRIGLPTVEQLFAAWLALHTSGRQWPFGGQQLVCRNRFGPDKSPLVFWEHKGFPVVSILGDTRGLRGPHLLDCIELVA